MNIKPVKRILLGMLSFCVILVNPLQAVPNPTIETAISTNSGGSQTYDFEFTLVNLPVVWNNAANSGNDLLHLTSPETPFESPLSGGNTVNIYFALPDVLEFDVFNGGFFTDRSQDFLLDIENATFNYYVLGDGNGDAVNYNGVAYYSLAAYNDQLSFRLSTILIGIANFSDGDVEEGYLMMAEAVPEPSTYVLLGLGMASLWMLSQRKKVLVRNN